MAKLDGEVIVIMSTCSGIGKATVEALAEARPRSWSRREGKSGSPNW
jgi:NAD(P)-dependent dehydrogenase (short-subunit alcohol dehydrogenase family)